MKSALKHIPRSLIEGTAWSVLIGCLLFSTLWFVEPSGDFASRDAGGCAGWCEHRSVFWQHTVNDLATWWTYVCIAFALLRHHPIMRGVLAATTAIYAAVSFFIGCGGKHLLDAYTNFNPIYFWSAQYGSFNAVASVIGGITIPTALDAAFNEVRKQRARIKEEQARNEERQSKIDELERKLASRE